MAAAKNKLTFEEHFLKLQFSSKRRNAVLRKIERYISNGISLVDALKAIYRISSYDGKKPKAVEAQIVGKWLRGVQNEGRLGPSIANWVPEQDRDVIEAGEESGKLAEAIRNALYINEGKAKIRGALIGGLAYPALILCVVIAFFYIFGTQVIPSFEEVLPREQWYGQAASMGAMSDFVRNYLIWVLVGVVLLGIAMFWSFPNWTGRGRAKVDNFPPFSLYRLMLGTGFMLSVSGLLQSGQSIPKTLELLLRNANPYYRSRLVGALRQIREGSNFGEALHRTGYGFPEPDTVMDLRSYSDFGDLQKILAALATEWMNDSVERIQRQTATMRNILIVFSGVVIGWMASGVQSIINMITTSVS